MNTVYDDDMRERDTAGTQLAHHIFTCAVAVAAAYAETSQYAEK